MSAFSGLAAGLLILSIILVLILFSLWAAISSEGFGILSREISEITSTLSLTIGLYLTVLSILVITASIGGALYYVGTGMDVKSGEY